MNLQQTINTIDIQNEVEDKYGFDSMTETTYKIINA